MSFWTDENIAKLKRLWSAGQSAGRIAIALGTTRNSVISKIHREGLNGPRTKVRKPVRHKLPLKPSVSTHSYRQTLQNKIKELRMLSAEMRETDALTVAPKAFQREASQGIALLDALPHHCRWPFGSDETFRFCGANKVPGYPYCVHHCERAFQGVSKIKPIRPSRPMRRAA